jgi:hypothetical protein
MFIGLWSFLISGVWIVDKNTQSRIDHFPEPHGVLIAKISEGVFLQMIFCALIGITIGIYISGLLRSSGSALLLQLYDEVQELKKTEPNHALQTTPPAVTSRADARAAPSGSVSEL